MQLQDIFKHFCWLLRRRLRLIGIGTAIGTCTTLIISLCILPVYQASAMILVNSMAVTGNTDVYSDQALALSYTSLATKDDVLRAAVQQLPGTSVTQLRQAISSEPVNGLPVIEIRARTSSAQQAANEANGVANVFIHLLVARTRQDLLGQEHQLSQNLQAQRSSVDAAQARLSILQQLHASASTIAHQRTQLDSDQARYNALLDDYHQLQQREAQVNNELTVSRSATVPTQSQGPNVWLNTVIALFASLWALFLWVLVQDWLDDTVKTDEDVRNLAAITPLGSIPLCESKLPNVSPSPIMHHEQIEDAFVAIGASVRANRRAIRSLLVTGLRPGVGVSTTAVHLALSLARAGMRILLIDANLRRPALQDMFQGSGSVTLVNCLAEMQMFHEQISDHLSELFSRWKTANPHLWVLPAGPVSSYPSSILDVPELAAFVQALLDYKQNGQAIDMIIFDTAPLHAGSDGLAVAAVADATLLVADAGKQRGEALREAGIIVERVHAPVLGAVVNRHHSGQHAYFYIRRSAEEPGRHCYEEDTTLTQTMLPETPRPHALMQELLIGPHKMAAQETPPAVEQVLPLGGMPQPALINLPSREKAGNTPAHESYLLPFKKSLDLPGVALDQAHRSRVSGLRQYLNSNWQLE